MPQTGSRANVAGPGFLCYNRVIGKTQNGFFSGLRQGRRQRGIGLRSHFVRRACRRAFALHFSAKQALAFACADDIRKSKVGFADLIRRKRLFSRRSWRLPKMRERGKWSMGKLAVGILAHVDAGKTTLSEAMLYRSGCLKKLGRVDHRDAFLDTDALERERGITIFSKQAELPVGEWGITLLDTPGHVDFSSEMERVLGILDYAVLVISGADGIQGHTRTLWDLLARYRVPVFLFVNKMDLPGSDREGLLSALKSQLGEGCAAFGGEEGEAFWEEVALCDEQAMARYLEDGVLPDKFVASLVAQRRLFPCYFGSALRLDGVDALLKGIERFTQMPDYPETFGARIYKIGRDPGGARLTFLKVTGGSLRVKALLTNRREGMPEGAVWEGKADQLRIYSGSRYRLAEEVFAGEVCAVAGLDGSRPGEGLGCEAMGEPPSLEPVLTYRVELPEGCDPHLAFRKLRQLEEEDPQLRLSWDGQLREIQVRLMGEVQMEVLQRLIRERFGWEVSFGTGSIVYRETIAAPVEGIGHFEPLRHYAEVHLLLEPGEPGSGLEFGTACSEEMLDRSWQRLILTHLEEQVQPGVLTGSPVTDLRITLVAGRAHEKHTEGGDFRQATYRAVRQGLMSAESILLEPWYRFRLELPAGSVGRALNDLQRRHGQVDPPETAGADAVVTGSAPVACMRDYAVEVASYTRGQGRLSCTLLGYAPCHNQQEVVEALGYDSERDLEHPADSVFCAHGAGFTVRWDRVREYMHVESGLPSRNPGVQEAEPAAEMPRRAGPAYGGSLEQDKELQAIFERTYGPIKRRAMAPQSALSRVEREGAEKPVPAPVPSGPEYLLVDGYNILHAWDELKEIARDNLDAARGSLMDLMSNYQGYCGCEVILVFDAYKVPGNPGSVTRYHNIHVVYTKEAETADAYIEKATYEIGKNHRVRVATSDSAEQLIILGHGALRLSARAFREEVELVEGKISAALARSNRRVKSDAMRDAFEKAGR